jgi:hypothetical protein
MSDEKNIHKCRNTGCSVMVDGLVYCRTCLRKMGDRFAESQMVEHGEVVDASGLNDSVEEIFERKFHEYHGQAGKIFGVEITTRFSKQALIGAMIIMMEQHKGEVEVLEGGIDMMKSLSLYRYRERASQ